MFDSYIYFDSHVSVQQHRHVTRPIGLVDSLFLGDLNKLPATITGVDRFYQWWGGFHIGIWNPLDFYDFDFNSLFNGFCDFFFAQKSKKNISASSVKLALTNIDKVHNFHDTYDLSPTDLSTKNDYVKWVDRFAPI